MTGRLAPEMDERTRRIAENEAVARMANEKLEDLNATFSTFSGTFAIACECGSAACTEQINVAQDDYGYIRSDPTYFAVVRGHEANDVEHVIVEHDGYVVVRKDAGLPTQLAEATDPRSSGSR
jgi:hypothetical protein